MSTTNFPSSNASVVKLWSAKTLYDFQSDTALLGQMIRDGVVAKQEETSRSAGDRVTISWLNRLTDAGLLGSAAATGQEAPLVYATDNLLIDQLRIPIQIPAPNTIDQQRVMYNLTEDSYRVMSEWMMTRGTTGVLNQLCGNTATTITFDGVSYSGNDRLKLTGLNAAIAPTTTSGVQRIIRPNGLTTDQAVAADTTATAKLSQILQAETIAQTQRPYIRPLSETSDVKFNYYVHNQVFTDLLQDTSSPFQYRDLQQSLITSGRGMGEIQRSFVFSQTRVISSAYLPLGVNSSTSAAVANCRRSAFVGRDAAGIAYGRGFSDGSEQVAGFRINSDYTDIAQWQRYAMVGVWGLKKLQFASDGSTNDNAVIVISNYSSI